MKIFKINHTIISSLFFALILTLFIPQAVFCQTEKLGIVKYTPPKDWAKTSKKNIIAFSKVNQTAGNFCIITLYGATKGTGKPKSDFTREWTNLVAEPFSIAEIPKTETESADGWTATAGGSMIEFQGSKALAFLTVYSGFDKTVSILGVFNDESYLPNLTAFVSAIDIENTAATAVVQPEKTSPQSPVAATVMSAAELVGEFENNEIRANQNYIGKRVRINGTVNIIEINKDGQIVLTFKSSIYTSRNARCYFNKSQSSKVAGINANEKATVEGTVKGLGDGFDNSKAYLVLENCIVP